MDVRLLRSLRLQSLMLDAAEHLQGDKGGHRVGFRGDVELAVALGDT